VLRTVELDDIEIFYTQEADPVANAMAAFPARDRTAHAAHWQKVLAHDSNVARTIVEQGQVWSVFADPQSDITRSLLGAIRPQLPAELAARLLPASGAETILRVDVAGEAASGPLLSDLSTSVPGAFRLVHGGIDHIQQQPVGTLFLSVPGSDASHLAEIITFLKARQARVEVLGHVANPV